MIPTSRVRTLHISHHVCTLLLAGSMILAAPSLFARSATAVHEVESKLSGGTILNSSPDKLANATRECVKENPARAGMVVKAVLAGGRADADAIAPQITAAAIEALGKDPASNSVTDIVYSAVKATPSVVLEIVRASVKVAPGSAKTIVRAAVKAVPNPNDKIPPVAEKLPDRGLDKDEKDMPAPEAANTDDPAPIGEAIARAAQQADPSLSLQELMNTANQAAHDTNFTNTSTYKGYYYPPLLAGVPRTTPTPSPSAVPSPPIVSK